MINPFENGLICGVKAALECWEFWAAMSFARGSEAGVIWREIGGGDSNLLSSEPSLRFDAFLNTSMTVVNLSGIG